MLFLSHNQNEGALYHMKGAFPSGTIFDPLPNNCKSQAPQHALLRKTDDFSPHRNRSDPNR